MVLKQPATRLGLVAGCFLVEISGIEPLTSWMPFKRSPSWAIPPCSIFRNFLADFTDKIFNSPYSLGTIFANSKFTNCHETGLALGSFTGWCGLPNQLCGTPNHVESAFCRIAPFLIWTRAPAPNCGFGENKFSLSVWAAFQLEFSALFAVPYVRVQISPVAQKRLLASVVRLVKNWGSKTLETVDAVGVSPTASKPFVLDGAEGGIWTLARFYPPTPLAGEPLQPLGYFCMTENLTWRWEKVAERVGFEPTALSSHQFSRLAP